MVKNRYEILKGIENFDTLISRGIISIIIVDWIVIYEYYLSERLTEKKMQSYENTAEKYNISEKQVRNVVNWMEGY